MELTNIISTLKKFILSNVFIQKIILLLIFQYILAAFLYILSGFIINYSYSYRTINVVHTIDGGVMINRINPFICFYSPINPDYLNLLRFYDMILLFNISNDQYVLLFSSGINYLMWLIYLISDNLTIFHKMYILPILYTFISYIAFIWFLFVVGYYQIGTVFFLSFPYAVMKRHLHLL